MAIHHTAMYEECHKAMAKQKVALEVYCGPIYFSQLFIVDGQHHFIQDYVLVHLKLPFVQQKFIFETTVH